MHKPEFPVDFNRGSPLFSKKCEVKRNNLKWVATRKSVTGNSVNTDSNYFTSSIKCSADAERNT